jgi:hypothetical protein
MSLQEVQANATWDQKARTAINTAIRKLGTVADLVVSASTTVAGLLEIATDAEAQAKTATDKALVPSNLAAIGSSTTFAGLIEIATDAEAVAVTATDKALVPSNFSGKAGQQTYVQGTFTPGIQFGGGTTGITYTDQIGVYTRIGRVVVFDLMVTLSAKGSSTGSAQITGLPITAAGNAVPSIHVTAMTAGVGDTHVQSVVASATTNIVLRDISGGSQANLTDVDFTNTSQIRISGTYIV